MVLRRACLALLVWLWPASAAAHHPEASGPPVVRSRVGLELAAAEVAEEALGEAATWRAANLTIEGAFLRRFSLAARLGFAHLRRAGATTATGPTDLGLQGNALVLGDDDSVAWLRASFGVELPTAEPDSGLGDGHTSLSPVLQLTLQPLPYLQFGVGLDGHFAVGGHEHGHGHGSFLAPHESRELYPRAWLGGRWQSLYAQLGAEVGLVLVEDHDLLGPVTLQGEAGVQASEHVRVGVRAQGPLAGPERLAWRAGVGAEYLF